MVVVPIAWAWAGCSKSCGSRNNFAGQSTYCSNNSCGSGGVIANGWLLGSDLGQGRTGILAVEATILAGVVAKAKQ